MPRHICDDSGIACPKCGELRARVIESRPHIKAGVGARARRRVCRRCKYRWNTLEMSELDLAGFARWKCEQATATKVGD